MDERVIGGRGSAANDFSLPSLSNSGNSIGGRNVALTPIQRKGGGTGIGSSSSSSSSSPGVTRVDVGSAAVEEKKRDPFPLYHLKGRNLIIPVQVDCHRGSLNSGDVFVLDMRAHEKYCVVQWTGAEANRREKAAGRQYCEKLVAEVRCGGHPRGGGALSWLFFVVLALNLGFKRTQRPKRGCGAGAVRRFFPEQKTPLPLHSFCGG
jgi:hypothetical protein